MDIANRKKKCVKKEIFTRAVRQRIKSFEIDMGAQIRVSIIEILLN
jgi:hypothetical protein